MTDVWRSYVAQRIAWTFDWNILFHSPTTYQERNVHDIMKDFEQEIDGYLLNAKICDDLSGIQLKTGTKSMFYNLRVCYEKLVQQQYIEDNELDLLEAWIADLKEAGFRTPG